jgi:hypothetical protein
MSTYVHANMSARKYIETERERDVSRREIAQFLWHFKIRTAEIQLQSIDYSGIHIGIFFIRNP